jgi:hypothetical protein
MIVKLYLLEKLINTDYAGYNALVVAAENEEQAKDISPVEGSSPIYWVSDPRDIRATYLGEAADGIEHGLIVKQSYGLHG